MIDFIFLGSKITADGDCNLEIKRHFFLGRKVMNNLDSILKSRDITLPTNIHLIKAMVFPVVMYGCDSWTIKKAECQRKKVKSLSHVWLIATLWTVECQTSLSITNSQSLFKLMPIELVMPSNHLILCCPLLLLPRFRAFPNESTLCMRWPKYWSFSFNISPSNEHPGLISFRMDWLDLLAVQGTLKSLLK